ncbi:hypothetical protein L1887_08807 [Cichorium endivia]|nr:hypothetical protein L1887_08807 [Cichorium endivia]
MTSALQIILGRRLSLDIVQVLDGKNHNPIKISVSYEAKISYMKVETEKSNVGANAKRIKAFWGLSKESERVMCRAKCDICNSIPVTPQMETRDPHKESNWASYAVSKKGPPMIQQCTGMISGAGAWSVLQAVAPLPSSIKVAGPGALSGGEVRFRKEAPAGSRRNSVWGGAKLYLPESISREGGGGG